MGTTDAEPVGIICNPNKPGISHTPDAEIRWCSVCAQEIWVAQSTFAIQRHHPHSTLICFECAPGVIDSTGGEITIHGKTANELLALGFTKAQVSKMITETLRDLRDHPE